MIRLLKIIQVACIVAALLTLIAICARADTAVSVDEIFNIQTIDVDSDPGKKNTCAHAAMANAISAGLGNTQEQAVRLYRHLVRKMGDKPASPGMVWEELMKGSNASAKNKYRSFFSYFGDDTSRSAQRVLGALLEGRVVVLVIIGENEEIGHAVTVYGAILWGGGAISLTYVDNEDGEYRKYTGRTFVVKGKTYLTFRDGDTMLIAGYATVLITEEVIERGLRQ